jgi:dTMP kinase
MDSDAAAARLTGAADRLEKRGGEYRRKLRSGFVAEAQRNPKIVLVDAARPIDEVAAEIRKLADTALA